MSRLDTVKKLINDKFDGNQADFARAIQKAPAQVNQWLNGYRNIGDAVALHIEKSLNLPIGFLDGEQGEMRPAPAVYIPPAGGIAVLEETDTTHTHREIQMYDLKLSADNGNAEWVLRRAEDPLVFREGWFRAKHLSPHNLRGMYVKGDSMKPVLNNWDTVLIDVSDTELVDGEIYTVVYREKFYIKQVKHLADGIEMISFNPEYEPMPVKNGDVEKFQCLGRMVWRGG